MDRISFKLVENDFELEEAFRLRQVVFVEEQGVDLDIEYDGQDSEALHMVVKKDNKTIGTARVRFLNAGIAKIERMAILKPYRRQGIGRSMMSFLDSELRTRHIEYVSLHAQCIVIAFYESCGYTAIGSTFWEAGIEHVTMEKRYIS